jgi:hypothetical protein
MWQRSFVAVSVLAGASVDEALAALEVDGAGAAGAGVAGAGAAGAGVAGAGAAGAGVAGAGVAGAGAGVAGAPGAGGAGAALGDLVPRLRDPRRVVRAQALATVGQEVALAVDEMTLAWARP